MASEDKTEAPTPKRLQEARQRGQIPVSRELGTAFGLLTLFGVLGLSAPRLMAGYRQLLQDGLLAAGRPTTLSEQSLFGLMHGLVSQALPLLALPVLAVGLVGVMVNLLQTRFNFSIKALQPDIKKLNPLQGLKRLFGLRGVFETGKELIKITVIGSAAWLVLWPQRYQLAQTVGMSPVDLLPHLARLCWTLGLSVAAAYVALAVADYLFQRWQTMRELRMTKEEVRQEYKQMDMPAEVKRAIKQRQREAAQRRMLQQVPQADVVVTNPTHFAVALRYDPLEPSPKVIAKGQDLMAQRIRQLAEDSDVQIVANPPLARSLYQVCEVGSWIPEELFVAVAEVLAFVFRRREQNSGSGV